MSRYRSTHIYSNVDKALVNWTDQGRVIVTDGHLSWPTSFVQCYVRYFICLIAQRTVTSTDGFIFLCRSYFL